MNLLFWIIQPHAKDDCILLNNNNRLLAHSNVSFIFYATRMGFLINYRAVVLLEYARLGERGMLLEMNNNNITPTLPDEPSLHHSYYEMN